MPVEIEGTANVMQNLTSLGLHISTAQTDTPIILQAQEADSGHVLDQAKQLLSIPVDGHAHGSIFRGKAGHGKFWPDWRTWHSNSMN